MSERPPDLSAACARCVNYVYPQPYSGQASDKKSLNPGESTCITMRPLFTIDPTGHLVSCIQDANSRALNAIKAGTRFVFEQPYSTPWGEVPAGVVAIVTEVHEETGELDLEAEGIIPALVLWSNLLIMLPFMSDDLSACLHLLV